MQISLYSDDRCTRSTMGLKFEGVARTGYVPRSRLRDEIVNVLTEKRLSNTSYDEALARRLYRLHASNGRHYKDPDGTYTRCTCTVASDPCSQISRALVVVDSSAGHTTVQYCQTYGILAYFPKNENLSLSIFFRNFSQIFCVCVSFFLPRILEIVSFRIYKKCEPQSDAVKEF